ncbi:MAG TPA: hypothetical protein VK134_03395 [Ktedonobacteraceae bacterium]|nr:hypothetical protein [Ktedonobacteraceae bacterium]
MLLELAIGDAYGAGFEYVDTEMILRYKLGPKKALGSFLEEYVAGRWAVPWTGKVQSQGWMSVRAAITALIGCSAMSDVLKTCIQFSGDVDTVAAIALAAGSCSTEIAQDLPVHLFDELENGQYGRDYIHSLDTQLMAFFRTINSTDKRENRLVDDGKSFFREGLLPQERA